jgi:hypothetical protein
MFGANIRVRYSTLFFDALHGVISHPALAIARQGHKQYASSGLLDRHKTSQNHRLFMLDHSA